MIAINYMSSLFDVVTKGLRNYKMNYMIRKVYYVNQVGKFKQLK